MKPPRLRLETGANAFGFDRRGERSALSLAGRQSNPDNAGQTRALERPDLAELQLETGRLSVSDAIGDRLRNSLFQVAKEANRDVQLLIERPAKLRCERGAPVEVALEMRPMLLGQRQPEERADP